MMPPDPTDLRIAAITMVAWAVGLGVAIAIGRWLVG